MALERPARPRFGVRAMLAAVAVAALVCAAAFVWLPPIYNRARIDAILRAMYAAHNPKSGFLSTPVNDFHRLRDTRPDDHAALLRDPRAVVRRLLRSIEEGDEVGEPNKRRNGPALWFLDLWLAEVDSVALAREALDRLWDLALSGRLPGAVQTRVIAQIGPLGSQVGIDEGRRAAIRDRVRAAAADPSREGSPLWAWAGLAASIGGREEVDLLLDLLDGGDPDVILAVQDSGLRDTRWPGIIPRLRPLLDRTKVEVPLARDGFLERLSLASWALGFPVLVATREGRAFLLEYARDARRPIDLRRKAIHILKRDPRGLALLVAESDDPSRRPAVAALFGKDHRNLVGGRGGDVLDLDNWPTFPYAQDAADPADPRPELRRLQADRTDTVSPASDLIGEVFRGEATNRPASDPVPAADRARRAELAVERLKRVVPPPHPKTSTGWAARVRDPDVKPLPFPDWLAVLEQTPDDAGRIDHPYGILSLGDDSIAILARIARSLPDAFGADPAKLLLLKGDRADEAPILIGRMARLLAASPDKLSARDPATLSALRRRFAVNHFWDVEAWKAWWKAEADGAR